MRLTKFIFGLCCLVFCINSCAIVGQILENIEKWGEFNDERLITGYGWLIALGIEIFCILGMWKVSRHN